MTSLVTLVAEAGAQARIVLVQKGADPAGRARLRKVFDALELALKDRFGSLEAARLPKSWAIEYQVAKKTLARFPSP